MPGSTLYVKDAEVRAALARFVKDSSDGRRPLFAFFSWWKLRVAEAWANVKATGGNFRGVAWPAMQPQYTRKTDGVTVPAWGGVPRLARGWRKFRIEGKPGRRGTRNAAGDPIRMRSTTGNVSGKLRPSGQRVKQSSTMMQDTGNMRNSIIGTPLALTNTMLTIGPKGAGEKYASEQHERRNVVFWAAEDPPKFEQVIGDYVSEKCREFNSGKR